MSDSGDRDTNVCATSFQFQTPTSVLTSSSLIMNDRTVTPKDNTSVQGIYTFPGFTVETYLFCAIVCTNINNTMMSLLILLAVSHLIICFPAEKCYQGDGHLPLFHTGSGRSVTVSKSSIKRASAILEPRNIAKELEGTSFSKHHHITILYLLCTCMFLIPDKHVSHRDLLR